MRESDCSRRSNRKSLTHFDLLTLSLIRPAQLTLNDGGGPLNRLVAGMA